MMIAGVAEVAAVADSFYRISAPARIKTVFDDAQL